MYNKELSSPLVRVFVSFVISGCSQVPVEEKEKVVMTSVF